MIDQWRLFVAALRFVTLKSLTARSVDDAPPHQATRYIPIIGILVGLAAASAYWISAQLWPASIAVVLSMFATAAITGEIRPQPSAVMQSIFVVLTKYNVLIALSAASLPFPMAANLALCFIMVAGHAASRALVVSVMATRSPFSLRVSSNDLGVALIIGFAPAVVLRVPGLVGLVTALVMRQLLTVYIVPKLKVPFREHLDITQQATEIGFYLGALAAWRYI